MSDDVSDIATYYSDDPEREHYRLERHQLEYELTWCYLDRYLPPQGSILEIGAATGRYTLELARRGYAVTAVDLSATQIELNRKRLADEGLQAKVSLVLADARNLSQLSETGFDTVLVMGPLYHLIEEADRKLVLQEAFDRLQDGGILFSAFISRFGIFGDLLKDIPDWLRIRQKSSPCWKQGNARMIIPVAGFVDTLPGSLRSALCMKQLDSKPWH